MSHIVESVLVAVLLSLVGGLVRLFGADLLRAKAPRLYAWLTGWRGLVARWTVLGVVMLGAAGFCVFAGVTMPTGPTGNRAGLLGFAAVSLSVVLMAGVQSWKVLRAARLEGRR